MDTKSATEKNVLWIGIDWGDQEHVVCVIGTDGERLETLRQEPEEIAAWVGRLKQRFPRKRMLIALEQSRGALMAALSSFDDIELYPINPKQLASYRDAVCPSGAKDDPADARLLAKFLQHHHRQLRRWQPDTVQTRRIAELCELRRKLVEDRKRLVLQLGSSLKLYFPLVLKLAAGTLSHELVLDLLRRWPTLRQLKRVHPKTLRTFLAEHGQRNAERQTAFIHAVRSAVPLTKDKALIEPRALYVQTLVGQIKDLNRAITQFDDQLRQAVAVHPDQAIYRALPGAGDALVPRMIAAWGEDRSRYESAAQMQCFSGIAPVTRASGNSRHVNKRLACPKFLRQTSHEFADHARQFRVCRRASRTERLVQSVLPHETRRRHETPCRRPGPGLQVDPHHLPSLEDPPPLQRSRLPAATPSHHQPPARLPRNRRTDLKTDLQKPQMSTWLIFTTHSKGLTALGGMLSRPLGG